MSNVLTTYLSSSIRLEIITEFHQSKASGIPDLVTELAIAFDTENIQVDITTTSSISTKSETQSISTTLRNTLGEISFLS